MRIFRSLGFSLLLATALAAFACGKIPESGSGDDGSDIDAGGPDAAPAVGNMTLRVWNDMQQPADGVLIVLTRPDGTYVGDFFAGSTGSATFEVTAGDIVHVGVDPVGGTGGLPQVFTIVGVEPGDDIPVNEPRVQSGTNTNLGNLTVTMPAVGGATTRYVVSIGCTESSATSTTVTLSVSTNCVGPDGKIFVIAWAQDAAGLVLKSAVLGAIMPPTPGTAVTANVAIWQDPLARDLRITGMPGTLVRVSGQLETFVGRERYEGFEAAAVGLATSQTFRMVTAKPSGPAYPTHAQLTAGYSHVTGGPPGGELIDGTILKTAKRANLAANATPMIDMTERPPRFLDATVSPGLRTFTWSTQSTPAELTFQAGSDFMFFFANFDAVSRWIVMAPPGTTSPITFDLHTLNNKLPDDDTSAPFSLILIDAEGLAGYGAVKNGPGTSALETLFDDVLEFSATASFSGAGLD